MCDRVQLVGFDCVSGEAQVLCAGDKSLPGLTGQGEAQIGDRLPVEVKVAAALRLLHRS